VRTGKFEPEPEGIHINRKIPSSPCGFPMPEFAIERVTKKTVPDFLYLLGELARYEQLDPPDEGARVRLVADTLQDPPKVEAYLGRLGDDPAGFVTFCFTYSTFLARPTLYLEDIFVLEPYRNRGLGTRLFSFCRNEALARGCGRMDWLVLAWNQPSMDFYEKAGARPSGWRSYRLERGQF
jgi:GNAT superfamily N-acetyltransferase